MYIYIYGVLSCVICESPIILENLFQLNVIYWFKYCTNHMKNLLECDVRHSKIICNY
jgi:hypothetical protein